MKRFFTLSFLVLAISFISLQLPATVFAQGINASSTGIGTTANAAGFTSAQDPAQLIGRIIAVGLGLVGFVFFAYTLYAGFLWMTAAGNAENVEKAQGMIKNGVIGFLIIASAFSIADFVVKKISCATGDSTSCASGTSGP